MIGFPPPRRPSWSPGPAAGLRVLLILLAGCAAGPPPRDYREDMRLFVRDISAWAKSESPGFLVIPQNGQELFTLDGEPDGPAAERYMAAIDGSGREDLYFGWDQDSVATPAGETAWLEGFLDRAEFRGIEVLVTDYVDEGAPMGTDGRDRADESWSRSAARGYIAFPAPSRGLEVIPAYPDPPVGVSADDVTGLDEAANFLYLIDPGSFATREAYLSALGATDFDLLIIDACWDGDQFLDAADVARLKTKAGGGQRLVAAYLSIGEAEDYRPYWRPEWEAAPPHWLGRENPDWPGNYTVRYWDSDWQALIFGSAESSLGRILAAGFDGVYLDIIDAFERFE